MNFRKIEYRKLNTKQQETYNFQDVSAILATYGFATIRLYDDWQGADFIAQHIDGETFLKVQLKGRLTFDKKYKKKNIRICFPYPSDPAKGRRDWYLFDYDKLLAIFLEKYKNTMTISSSWVVKGNYSWGTLSKDILTILSDYKL